WTRLPGFRDVTAPEWESAQWQRAHTVKNLKELKGVLGDFLTDDLAADVQRDMFERATMSMLLPPQMINTMDERDLRSDPVRRDIRLATKGRMGLPQHFLQPDVLAGMERIGANARERGVSVAVHTHVNHANQLTPLVAKAVDTFFDFGFRDVRNQGVLLRGVN